MIGNSRWHWAAPGPSGLVVWHGPPEAQVPDGLLAWAAVGPMAGAAGLADAQRLRSEQVPLAGTPAWIGVDRALAAWEAAAARPGEALLVADAGTVLSLTRVDATGCFAGGRLLAGAGLQLRAMAAAAALLPDPVSTSDEAWPAATEAAMVSGVQRGLAAAVVAAAREAAATPLHLWLTGGDGAALLPWIGPALRGTTVRLHHDPDLCLRAMARLRPALPADEGSRFS